MLTTLGAEPIDADTVYHGLIGPGMPLWRALRDAFGREIVTGDGEIDRMVLGARVFSDLAELARLDALTHPAVVAEIERRIAASSSKIIAIDAVKLMESGLIEACDVVWVVTCHPEQQITRLEERNGLSRADAEARVATQPPIADKLVLADVVIDNGGDLVVTRRQVEAAWADLGDGGARRADENLGGVGYPG